VDSVAHVQLKGDKRAETIADLQSKLAAARAELQRAAMERDYLYRLLRQQQTLGTASAEIRAASYALEKNSLVARFVRRTPKKIKQIIPFPIKQILRRIIVRIA
jgi:hypothetical protein